MRLSANVDGGYSGALLWPAAPPVRPSADSAFFGRTGGAGHLPRNALIYQT
jgi:hypothetical protein